MAQSSVTVDSDKVKDWAAQSAPARQAVSVTPSNSTEAHYRALYIGTTGNLAVIPAAGGSAVTFTNVPVGWFPVSVRKVMSTGTTASGIIGVN